MARRTGQNESGPTKPKSGGTREETTDRVAAKTVDAAMAPFDPEKLDWKTVTGNPRAAQHLVSRLVEEASDAVGDHEWSPQDVRDIIEFAERAAPTPVQVMEGRHLRKRVKEQLARTERYHESFSLLFVTLGDSTGSEMYSSVLDALIERLRKTDLIFLFRRRFAILLPHANPPAVGALGERIRKLIGAVVGPGADDALSMQQTSYPSPAHGEEQSLLDWCEDQLRE